MPSPKALPSQENSAGIGPPAVNEAVSAWNATKLPEEELLEEELLEEELLLEVRPEDELLEEEEEELLEEELEEDDELLEEELEAGPVQPTIAADNKATPNAKRVLFIICSPNNFLLDLDVCVPASSTEQ
jgi:methylase of polypeptide subunit release factors